MTKPYDAILFDCDGVLVDSEVVGLDASVAFLAEHGFDWTPGELVRRFTGMRQDEFSRGLAAAQREVLGRAPSAAEAEALMAGLIEARRSQRHTMQLVPGAAEAVEAAVEAGLAVAVASSSAQAFLDDKIERFGLKSFFGEHVYSADAVDAGKPAPDIFLHAAERLGVPPAHCVVIEDSAHGVAAGVAAGSVVWGFTGGGHCYDGHAARLRSAGSSLVLHDHTALRREITKA